MLRVCAIGGLCLLVFAAFAVSAKAQVTFYENEDEFNAEMQAKGKFAKTSWDFEPNIYPPNAITALDAELNIDTHGADPRDPWPGLWPADMDNLTFASNLNPQGPYQNRGVDALAFATPGFMGIDNNILVANTFVDSFVILSGPPAGDNHSALAMDLISLVGAGSVHVTVYDKADMEIGKERFYFTPGTKMFLGIDANPGTIGRVDIWDEGGGAEGVSWIAAYIPEPASLSLLLLGGLALLRRR